MDEKPRKSASRVRERSLYAYMQIQDVGGARVLAFDRQGQTLACGGAQPTMAANVQGVPTLLLFDWQSGKLAQSIALGKASDGWVFDLVYHVGGFWMVVTSGAPGSGQLLFHRPGDEAPFFIHNKMANCHALSLHPAGHRMAVTATNRNSAGNGRPLKDGKYPRNSSPIHLWDLANNS